MKAHVFILQGQTALFKEISSLLRDEIYRDIEIERMEIDRSYNAESSWEIHDRCRTYMRFLRASLLASGGFEVVVHNNRQTHWCYLGYTAEFGGYCFELKHADMEVLFPAVAIMDRMVLLPEEFVRSLDVYPRTFLSMPRPLDLGGVELVDYRIKGVLKHAIHRVGLQLKREWKNLCHRHMGIRGLFKPDFQELGNLLNVDAEFLEANSLYAEDIRLEAAIVEGRALENSPSRVVLELRNPGGRPLKNIRVRVRAPGTTLKSPISQIRDLVPPETVRVDLDITPRTAPCCPLEVFIDLGDDPLEIPSFPIPVAIPVSPA